MTEGAKQDVLHNRGLYSYKTSPNENSSKVGGVLVGLRGGNAPVTFPGEWVDGAASLEFTSPENSHLQEGDFSICEHSRNTIHCRLKFKAIEVVFSDTLEIYRKRPFPPHQESALFLPDAEAEGEGWEANVAGLQACL